jgi:hypothetical protein
MGELDMFCGYLRSLLMELGALAMHDAANFLEQLWTNYEKKYEVEGMSISVDWKGIFHDAPLFLM